jgi:hypothetical protein
MCGVDPPATCGGSGEPDDEVLAGGLDDFVGDGGEVVDVEDATDLGEERWTSRKLPPVIRATAAMASASVKSSAERVRPSRW